MEAYRQAVAHGGQAEKLVQLGKEWAYRQAKALQQQKRYEAALSYFEEAQDYRDSVELAGECRKIVEKALAEQRRLEAETEAKEAAKEKAATQQQVQFLYPDQAPFVAACMPLHQSVLQGNPALQPIYDAVQGYNKQCQP